MPLVASMDWVVDVAVLEVARVEAQPPVVRLELARVEAQPPVMHLEVARVEVDAAAVRPWGPTYRVIRRYPPPTEAWEPLVRVVVAEVRQQPWARRTRPVRTVKRKR